MSILELQLLFEHAIRQVTDQEDNISKVATALVRALATSPIRRVEINAAYDREDI